MPNISIEFVIYLPQADFDVDVFVEFTLVIGVDENIGEWVLILKNHFMDSIKQVQIGLIF